ncbi:MAG TPA: transcription termination factor NusA [Kiritimatiellia bacterium]|nr:transcription termination factor NusA [Kiritimatiellia bacterium]HNR93157.1 transcription termination factor NusA [Kiritimatiellia bacterium]HNS80972.1 transcription termination factor NusA [Kiritimatiellia bacterium]HPA77858.1 transcription termination factor NusA [Kiritimatiellia bacterium]HQQ04270.1 transcription termination factor NusA [Kiritimatiellia bacterium]
MNNDLMAVFDYMERERGIDRETLIQAVEAALLNASKKSVGPHRDMRVEIDRKTCNIRALAKVQVVEKVVNPHEEVSLVRARRVKADAQIGDQIEIEVTPKNFGRIAAQTAKQAILHKIRQAEKDQVFDEYKDRQGEIVTGAVRRFDRNDVVVDLGRAEALMPSRERVPTEEYQIGDRIRAYLLKVDPQGPEVILSRSHPDFVRKLFELEVAEINDGTVEIKGIAREAGFRSKIAVISHDDKVDPVGACVGMRGIRVKNIVRELSGEKIDIVKWHDDIRTYVTNSLAPAKLSSVSVDEDTHTVSVVVDGDQLSLAIGKKGQNARLTSKLTGWKIDIRKHEAEISFEQKVNMAIQALAAVEGIGARYAEKLVLAGFLTLEGLLAADAEDLTAIEGISEDAAKKLQAAAEAAFEKEHGPIEE